MRRTIVRITVFLLAGAIVNVAVAWGCALEKPVFLQEHEVTLQNGPAAAMWLKNNGIAVEPHTKLAVQRKLGLMRQEYLGQPDFTWGESFARYAGRTEAGFPLRSLVGGFFMKANHGWQTPWAVWLADASDNADKEYLPLRPIWPGFLINTLFYALLLWLLFFAPGKLRRMTRRWRNRCPACAYPIGTSPVCTECGHPLT